MSCFQLDPRNGPFYFLERYSAKNAFDISRILCDNNKKSDKTYCRFIHKKITYKVASLKHQQMFGIFRLFLYMSKWIATRSQPCNHRIGLDE